MSAEHYTLKQAERAYRRLYNAAARESEMAAATDAGFDGGEFSRRWHDALFWEESERLAEMVAGRFGVDRFDLLFLSQDNAGGVPPNFE